MSAAPSLILASTSPYRRELLSRLGVEFAVARPETDETPQPGETPDALAVRLAAAKAEAALARGALARDGLGPEGGPANAWAIGSDQVAELDGRPLGKPGAVENAEAQLAAMSGRAVRFLTALCLAGPNGRRLEALDVTVVRFRALRTDEIARYVARERPLDCAGSFKSEGLGIALFEAIETRDPTALIGLPLIATARLLREAGYAIP
ncbi:MAG: septum formation protein Maf [Lysobacter sp.]|nr:MAG: septum formation protein Maf [Lysobacter sp.]